MIPQYELKAEDIRAYTLKLLKDHIKLKVAGYVCTSDVILDVLLKASAESSSIEAASNDLKNVADSNTIREYLNAVLDIKELRQQESEMNAALAECIPESMPRTKIEVAIDYHDEPFYGKQAVLREVTCSGQAKKGTTHFIRIASAYVIWRQVRLTLALRYVLPDESALDILKILLNRLPELGFHEILVLYLDKGFASTQIIDHLKERKQPTIIACPIRGKEGGTRALCQGRKSYRTDYTFTDGTSATLAFKATLVPDKSGKRRRKWLAFIVIELDWPPEKVHHEYRRRFGIECSYRILRRVRAMTTSRNPAVRFFLLAVGLILVNAWVFLRWEFARFRASGLRHVDEAHLRFHRFTRLLIRAIEDIYDVVMAIPTSQPPESVIY
jgi:Transposase DDE domain